MEDIKRSLKQIAILLFILVVIVLCGLVYGVFHLINIYYNN
jgi:hypothetical protein